MIIHSGILIVFYSHSSCVVCEVYVSLQCSPPIQLLQQANPHVYTEEGRVRFD